MDNQTPGPETLCGVSIGETMTHTFRGKCVVVNLETLKGLMPLVTVRFENGEEHKLSLPCPLLESMS